MLRGKEIAIEFHKAMAKVVSEYNDKSFQEFGATAYYVSTSVMMISALKSMADGMEQILVRNFGDPKIDEVLKNINMATHKVTSKLVDQTLNLNKEKNADNSN